MSVPTFSTTLKLCRALLGPTARVWRRKHGFEIGTERGAVRILKGYGPSLVEAVQNAFPEHVAMVAERLKHVRQALNKIDNAVQPNGESDGSENTKEI
jgi:hypothetical protein